MPPVTPNPPEAQGAVVFVSWVEANGTTVSHAINLRTNRLWSFVTYPVGDTRGLSFAEGEWSFE